MLHRYLHQSYWCWRKKRRKKKYNQSPFINVKHGLDVWPPFYLSNCNQFWIVCLAHSPNGYPNCLLTILFFHLFLNGPSTSLLFCPSQIVFSFFSFAAHKNDHLTCNLVFWFSIFAFIFVYCLLNVYKKKKIEWTIKFNFSMEQITNFQSLHARKKKNLAIKNIFPHFLSLFFLFFSSIHYIQYPIFLSTVFVFFAILESSFSEGP